VERQVMVIEDTPTIQTMLVLAFGVSGFQAVVTSSAEEALARLPDEQPIAILCDIQLPGMNGVEFTALLRSQSEFFRVPIVLMNGYDEPPNHDADAFVNKPFDPFEVVDKVMQCVGGRSAN